MSHNSKYNWNDCWHELHKLRRDMHRLFERMSKISPANQAVLFNVKQVAEMAMNYSGEVTGMDPNQIRGRCRKNNVAWARHIAIYCTKQLTGASVQEVCEGFPHHRRDIIRYACRKVRNESLPQYTRQVAAVMEKFKTALIVRPLVKAESKKIRPQPLKRRWSATNPPASREPAAVIPPNETH